MTRYAHPTKEAETNKLSRGFNTGSTDNAPNGADMAPKGENKGPGHELGPDVGGSAGASIRDATGSGGLRVTDEVRGRNRNFVN